MNPFDLFRSIFTPETTALWLISISSFVVDYFLTRRSAKYLSLSIKLFSVPQSINDFDSERIIKNKMFLVVTEEDTVYINEGSIWGTFWTPAIKYRSPHVATKLSNGEFVVPILRLIGFATSLLFLYAIFHTSWSDQLRKNIPHPEYVVQWFYIFLPIQIIISSRIMLKHLKLAISRPTNANTPDPKNVAEFRSKVRKVRKMILITFILYLPLSIPFALVFHYLKVPDSIQSKIMFGYFIVFAGLIFYSSTKLNRTVCIQCGNLFFRRGLYNNPYSGKCLNCGFPLKPPEN